jgi:hypothetical protein
MSLVSNPLIGRAKQSMGGATFTTWKGLQVLKNKATSVANPRSEGQINQRARLSILVAMYSFISSVIKQGFKEMAVGMSEFNGFTSANLKNTAVTASGGVAAVSYPDLLISKGSMASTPIDAVSAENGDTIVTVEFGPGNTNPNFSANDKTLVAIYNLTKDEWGTAIGTETRDQGGVEVAMPSALVTGNVLKVYLGFYNATTGKVSTSVFLNKVTTA